jgi:hypothetical protein
VTVKLLGAKFEFLITLFDPDASLFEHLLSTLLFLDLGLLGNKAIFALARNS